MSSLSVRTSRIQKSESPARLIIMDLYGILSLGSFWNVTHWLAKRYKKNPKEIYQVLYHKYFNAAALGKIGERELFVGALGELGIDIDWRAVRDKHLAYQVVNKPAIELCRKLQKEGYIIQILSKNIPAHFRHSRRELGLDRYFKHITNTYDLGLPKASKDTLYWAFKKFKVKPGEVIMCDDQDFNLVEAKKLGVRTVHYRTFLQFKRDLMHALA